MKKELFLGYISKKATHDVQIPDGLQDRLEYERMLPTYIGEWARITREQQLIVVNLRVDKDALYGELVKYYRFDDKYSWPDAQIKSQIMNNKRYIDISKELAEQEYYYDYVKDILDTVKSNHFIVQEYNKMKKDAEGTL